MPEAVVVGGGIGGLTCSLALRRVGWDVRVHERAAAVRGIGAGISLWSNAIKCLRVLGVADAVIAAGGVMDTSATIDQHGRDLGRIAVGEISRAAGEPSIMIHRVDLLEILSAAAHDAGVEIRTGAECDRVEDDGTRAMARFKHGGHDSGDVVIGADGIHSAVRSTLNGREPARYAGYTAWRGMAAFDHPALTGGGVFVLGPGSQMGVIRCGPGRVYWFITRNGPQGQTEPPEGWRAHLLASYADWTEVAIGAIRATQPADILHNDIIDRPPMKVWGRGRITLLGDSVHSTTPNMGQGGCMAIESALVLAKHLKGAADVKTALWAYEAERRPRTARTTANSWKFGKVFQWQNSFAVWLRARMLRSSFSTRQATRTVSAMLQWNPPSL